MKVFRIINGKIESNVYIVTHNNQTFIIDPGFDYNGIFRYVEENKLTVKAILLTHGHYDHCSALDQVASKYNCPAYMNLHDMIFIESPNAKSISIKGMSTKLNTPIRDIQTLNHPDISIFSSPGHSPGGVVFKFKNESSIFVGDSIFKNSVGRTDLPGSSPSDLEESLKMILSFPPKTVIYPGHGEKTSVEEELKYNPFIKKTNY
jgi:glyoxylase-like metal-dependent hydrolase (beta-lactamase superfamily II)